MFNPFGALTAAAGGAVKGYTEDAPKIYDMMGMQALGRAFQQMQGPIDQMNAQRGMPQPPMPGQPSSPGQPAGGPPMPPGPMQAPGGPPAAGPPPGPPRGPGGGGMPGGGPQGGMMPGGGQMIGGGPGGPGGPPMGGGGPQGGGMPQFDLQTLVTRINKTNPGLPPQAMLAALTRAAPLLNMQSKQELAALRQQMMAENLSLRGEQMNLRERSLGLQERGMDLREKDAKGTPGEGGTVAGYTPDAVTEAAERFRKTGQMPPGLRDRAGGNALRSAIANKAAELDKADNVSPAEIAKRQQVFKAEQVAIQRFMSGPQGNTTRSLGVVVDHLATMRDLTKALENGDTQLFNRVRQGWASATGSELPTNVNVAAQIVGSEIIKALGVAGAGTAEERGTAAQMFSTAKSPEQLAGAIKVAQRLLGGQLSGMRRQFVQSTGLKADKFDALLGEEGKAFLEGGGGGGPSDDSFDQRFQGGSAPKVDLGGGWSAQRVK